MCNMDLLITMELRFFESHQCAVYFVSGIYLHDFQTCFNLKLKKKSTQHILIFFSNLNNYFFKKSIIFLTEIDLTQQTELS